MQAGAARTPETLRFLGRLLEEALLQAGLHHPNVLGSCGAVVNGNSFAGFLMPFLQGGSLDAALRCIPGLMLFCGTNRSPRNR